MAGWHKSPRSGLLKIAQRFIAGLRHAFGRQSASRTAEVNERTASTYSQLIQPSVSRTSSRSHFFPSSKLLGYYHSSASQTLFCKQLTLPTGGFRFGRLAYRLPVRLLLDQPVRKMSFLRRQYIVRADASKEVLQRSNTACPSSLMAGT